MKKEDEYTPKYIKKLFKTTSILFGLDYNDFKTPSINHTSERIAFKVVATHLLVKKYEEIGLVAHLTGVKLSTIRNWDWVARKRPDKYILFRRVRRKMRAVGYAS